MARTRCIIVEGEEDGCPLVSNSGSILIYDDPDTACEVAARKANECGKVLFVVKLSPIAVYHRSLTHSQPAKLILPMKDPNESVH